MSTKVQTRHFHAGKLRKVSVATGTNRCSISRVLHGYQNTAGGYKWEVCNER